jgi:hypothetical protein
MNVIFYRNTAPPNKVNKTNNLYDDLTVENVRFKENGALDVLNPTIILGTITDIGDIVKYNYVKIPKLDRYYFISKISTEGGLIRIDCKCDVLFSHKKDILSSKQYILRQETKNNSPYLVDDMLPIRSDHYYLCKPFGRDVDDRTCGRIILATTGKGGTPI